MKKWKWKKYVYWAMIAVLTYVCVAPVAPAGGGGGGGGPEVRKRTSFYNLIENRTNLSVAWNRENVATVMTSLDALLRSTAYDVLCMHHLDIPTPFQACSLINRRTNQIYFMLNPKVVGKSEEELFTLEHSICHKRTQTKRRAKDVMVQWLRQDNTVMYALFESVAIQLAIEEFQCGEELSTNRLISS